MRQIKISDRECSANAIVNSSPQKCTQSVVRLEGRELVRATVTFAREQPLRSWWYLVSTAIVFAGCLTVAAAPLAWWLRALSAVAGGLTLCRLFIIYHDQQHGTILRGSLLAGWIMTAFGVLTLNPPSAWNASHNHHHRHNGKIRSASIGSFPVMTVAAYARASRRERWLYNAGRNPVTILLAWFTVFLLGMTVMPLIRKPREHLDCAVAVTLHLLLWALLVAYFPGALLFCFVVPLMIASALGAYLFYVQHNFPGVDLGDQSQWDYVFAALHSSSFLNTTPLMHWFTGNIGYHHIHHLNARIPFYRLPEAMKALPELQSPGRTSLSPSAIVACLRLKLWDPDAREMVSFRAVEPWRA